MKASEAKPLNKEELSELKKLLQRWILVRYPYFNGSNEQSDAIQTYERIEQDVDTGKDMPEMNMDQTEIERREDSIDRYGETRLD